MAGETGGIKCVFLGVKIRRNVSSVAFYGVLVYWFITRVESKEREIEM